MINGSDFQNQAINSNVYAIFQTLFESFDKAQYYLNAGTINQSQRYQ